MRTWSLRLLRQLFRLALSALHMLAAAASAAFKSRATLHLENLAFRHQLSVLLRSVKRPKLTSADRLLWAWLCEVWRDWRSALVIVKPETVIAWHRKGFRLFSVLDMEGASRPAWPACGLQGHPRTDPHNEPRESTMGRTSHPRRTFSNSASTSARPASA